MSTYYNFDYDKKEYYEVDHPMHDHYHYDYIEDAWYEIIYPISSAGEHLSYKQEVDGAAPSSGTI